MNEADFYIYLQGPLSKRRRDGTESHLLYCDDCRKKLVTIIHNLPRPGHEADWMTPPAPSYDIDEMLARILVRRKEWIQ